MRVVLDSNVIVAAFAARGLCAEIFRFAIDTCEIVASEALLTECETVLRKKLKIPASIVGKFISYLREELRIIEPAPVDADSCRDKTDLHVLGVALKSKAKFVITGDKDLLVLKRFKGTKIYNPRQFWDYVSSLRGSR